MMDQNRVNRKDARVSFGPSGDARLASCAGGSLRRLHAARTGAERRDRSRRAEGVRGLAANRVGLPERRSLPERRGEPRPTVVGRRRTGHDLWTNGAMGIPALARLANSSTWRFPTSSRPGIESGPFNDENLNEIGISPHSPDGSNKPFEFNDLHSKAEPAADEIFYTPTFPCSALLA
jgi:hypothetical protein